jgi:transposase InsO family protein
VQQAAVFIDDAHVGQLERHIQACVKIRHACLLPGGGTCLFRGMPMARRIIEAWRIDYNGHWPHMSLDGLTPNEFATRSGQDHRRQRQ